MEKLERLSIEDFKLNQLQNKTEIEKLMGGTAADCHITQTDACTFDDDCSPAAALS